MKKLLKTVKVLAYHAATVFSVMLIVFLIIDAVNPAMSFYDHRYTRALILALCAVTIFIPVSDKDLSFALPAAALSVFEAVFAVIGFTGGENNVFTRDAGHILCAVFAAFSLAQGVIFTVRDHNSSDNKK